MFQPGRCPPRQGHASASLEGACPSLEGASANLERARPRLERGAASLERASPRQGRASPFLACPSPNLAAPSPTLVSDPSDESGPLPPGEGMTADDFDKPDSPMRKAVKVLVGSKKGQELIASFIHEHLGEGVQPALLDDLRQGASVEAITSKWLPWTEGGMVAWLRRLTRWSNAHHFRAEAVHRKYLDRDKASEDERDRDDHGTDVLAREHRILAWMKTVITDASDQQTLALMLEHDDGASLTKLAEREKTTPSALSNRFYKLRKAYGPKISVMDDEPKRRAILFLLLLLFFGGIAWFAASLRPEPWAPPAPTRTRPTAMPVPTFDQALPPVPAPPPTRLKP
jgi:DNA-directed RNA polymerase specialized sigma24 family protein